MRKTNYYHPIEQPLLEGETTPLRNSQKYLDLAGNREPNIDWSVIPEMIQLVKESDARPWWREEAIGHLQDAMNEDLPEQRRMQHFDHAGSRIWEGMFRGSAGLSRNLGPLMILFKNAGGQ